MSPPKSPRTDEPIRPPVDGEPPLRMDARRNRDRLLAVARAAFAAADDTVALESIARDAGVGIGTLYRHFPSREVLVEAVYAAELDDLVESVPGLLDEFPPEIALRAWADRYAHFIATKRGMRDTLRAGLTSGKIATLASRKRISAALGTIVTAGARTGSLRGDIDPEDATVMLVGVFLATGIHGTPDQTARLLDLFVDALRPKRGSG